jgi:serine/threonine protein kinase
MPIVEVVATLRDVALALVYAHDRGVVHRHIKPDNVMLAGGSAVVTDCGIAKAISASRTDPGSATLTQAGTSLGTPAYMAPEQAAGDPGTTGPTCTPSVHGVRDAHRPASVRREVAAPDPAAHMAKARSR